MLNSRVQLPNLLDGEDSIHYGPFEKIYGLSEIEHAMMDRKDIAVYSYVLINRDDTHKEFFFH